MFILFFCKEKILFLRKVQAVSENLFLVPSRDNDNDCKTLIQNLRTETVQKEISNLIDQVFIKSHEFVFIFREKNFISSM